MNNNYRQYSCIVFCNESDVDNESVAEVPVTWLDETKTNCKWPPSPALVSLYINRYKKPMENWISYKVKVTATFATLEEARNFNRGETVDSSGRRQVKSPDIYSPDEFVEAKKVKRPTLPPNIDEAIHNKNEVQLCSQSSLEIPKVYTLLEAPNCNSVDSEDDVAVADEASGYNYELSSDPPIKSVEACCSNEKIINLLLDIKLEIANLTNKLTEQGLFNLANDPILENLPLQNLEDFQSLEGKLDTDPVLKKKLYKTYESVGGNGSRDFVIRCLKRSFTNDMAELCSWTGQKNNYKVADSPVMKVLHSAVKKTTGVSEKDFEIYVKDWLRHAKQRKERMLKKNKD